MLAGQKVSNLSHMPLVKPGISPYNPTPIMPGALPSVSVYGNIPIILYPLYISLLNLTEGRICTEIPPPLDYLQPRHSDRARTFAWIGNYIQFLSFLTQLTPWLLASSLS